MPSCCYADEYGDMFSHRHAGRTARRFRRKGLRGSAKQLADALAAAGVENATILEVGGGVGEIHIDLLRRGAATATNIELSPGWETAATEMLAKTGLQQRVHRRSGDFVDAAEELGAADVVILHRVVCCYPDWEAMISAATSKAERVVGVTLPVDHWTSRIAIKIGNGLLRLRRRSFRAYVHPVNRVVAALEADGFHLLTETRGRVWHTLVVERRASGSADVAA